MIDATNSKANDTVTYTPRPTEPARLSIAIPPQMTIHAAAAPPNMVLGLTWTSICGANNAPKMPGSAPTPRTSPTPEAL